MSDSAWVGIAYCVACFIIGFVLRDMISPVCAEEEIHHHEGMSEEIDKFYSKWMQPDAQEMSPPRTRSCCSKTDCAPAEIRRRNGEYEVLARNGIWVVIPRHKIEQNYPDAEESPDGRNHVCMKVTPYGASIYCATLGSGT